MTSLWYHVSEVIGQCELIVRFCVVGFCDSLCTVWNSPSASWVLTSWPNLSLWIIVDFPAPFNPSIKMLTSFFMVLPKGLTIVDCITPMKSTILALRLLQMDNEYVYMWEICYITFNGENHKKKGRTFIWYFGDSSVYLNIQI